MTRERIRTVAHGLFAEQGFDVVTIADIARDAGVAVQTVFNHFATKEELFFDGRTPWVEGPAYAVRARQPEVAPLMALREYLVEGVHEQISSLSIPERRCYMATVQRSKTLRSYELYLAHEAERQLAAALLEAWAAQRVEAPPSPQTAALITATVWLAAIRVLIVEQRTLLDDGMEPHEIAAGAHAFADRLLTPMEAGPTMLLGLPELLPRADVRWPSTTRRAG